MNTKTKTAAALALAAIVGGAMVPAAASAQPYYGGYGSYQNYGGYAYDGCQRSTTGRQTTGALLGAAAGAALGNNVSRDRSTRHNSSAALGVLGAIVGSQIGKQSAACVPGQATTYSYGAPAYSYGGYDRGYSYGGYGDDYDYDYDYDRYASTAPPPPPARPSRDGCRNVESRIVMPDGRAQTRLVRVCPDSRGDYQIVD